MPLMSYRGVPPFLGFIRKMLAVAGIEVLWSRRVFLLFFFFSLSLISATVAILKKRVDPRPSRVESRLAAAIPEWLAVLTFY